MRNGAAGFGEAEVIASVLVPVGDCGPPTTERVRVLRLVASWGATDVLLGAGDETHVRACLDGSASPAWMACSDVLYHARALVHPLEAKDALITHPGAAVCAGATREHGYVVAVRERGQISVLGGRARTAPSVRQRADFGSAVHAWLATGHRLDSLEAVRGEDGQMVMLAPLDVAGWRQAWRMSLI
jgi:hypothetical protein